MNETRIALAFVALGVALLVGTFAYLAYDPRYDDNELATASAEPNDGRSAATAVPLEGEHEGERASDPAGGADAPTSTENNPRPVAAKTDEPPSFADVPPPAAQATTSDPPAPVPAEKNSSAVGRAVPAYDAPLRESEADGVTEVVVGTETTDEEGMRLVASDLASYYPGDGVLLVEFREGASGDPEGGRESGFGLVFGSREAALAPDLEYTEQEVDELFEEDGGVRAVSYEDFGRENPRLKDDLARISAS